MPSVSPTLIVSKAGGAFTSGVVTCAFGNTIRLRLAQTAIERVRFEIHGYPDGWTAPAGWTLDAVRRVIYFDGPEPPDFTLPADTLWGKWLLRAIVDGNRVDDTSALEITGPGGLHLVAAGEQGQFGGATQGWIKNVNDNFKILSLGGGGSIAFSNDTPKPMGTSPGPGVGNLASRWDHAHELTESSVLNVLGDSSQPIPMGNQRVVAVGTPEQPTDAATKGYVDTAAARPKTNYTATLAPFLTDDTTAGYAVGSVWIDTAAAKLYTCLGAAAGAATWVLTAAAFSPASLPAGVLVSWHHVRSAVQVGGVASGAPVSGWTDLGPSADSLTASGSARPLYYPAQRGGRPRVQFDGVAQAMAGSGSSPKVFTVALFAGRVRWPSITRTSGDQALFAGGDTFPGAVALTPNDGSFGQVAFTGSGDGTTWFNGATQTVYRRNGVNVGTSSMAPGPDRTRSVHMMTFGTARTGNAVVVGRDRGRTAGGPYMPLDLGEVILLNNPTSEQIAQCEAYLASYWLSGSLVACSGDSITAGYQLLNTQAWPAVLDESWGGAVDFPNRAVTNQGVGASHSGVTTTMLANDGARVDSLLAGRTGTNVLAAFAGINDLIAGRTAAQLYADIQTYCAARRAAGWKVAVSTLIDCAYSGGTLRSQIAAYNTLLRNSHAFADAFADPALDAAFSSGAADSTVNYLADGIHPNVTGSARLATMHYGPAIASLLPA